MSAVLREHTPEHQTVKGDEGNAKTDAILAAARDNPQRTAQEISDMVGCSESWAYQVIKKHSRALPRPGEIEETDEAVADGSGCVETPQHMDFNAESRNEKALVAIDAHLITATTDAEDRKLKHIRSILTGGEMDD